jgi:hypothetical protein
VDVDTLKKKLLFAKGATAVSFISTEFEIFGEQIAVLLDECQLKVLYVNMFI